MWAGTIGLVGIIMVFVTLAVALIPTLSGRWVGILTMIPGAVTFLLCWMIGKVNFGVKGHLEIIIAGAILFGCGAIAAAVGQDRK
jgi:hypothetical protein